MNIGSLQQFASVSFTHAGVCAAFEPDARDGELFIWNWNTIYDSGLDVHMTLDRECFIGSITLRLTGDSAIREALVLADGKPSGRFAAQTGSDASGIITIPVGVKAAALILRLYGNLKKVAFPLPEIAGAYEDGSPLLWPEPDRASFQEGSYTIKDVICVRPGQPDEEAAAKFLRERLTERFGNWSDPKGLTVKINLDESGAYAGERFTVVSYPTAVALTAGARLTLHYAADVLLQLGALNGDSVTFRTASVDDRPYKPMRGFHIMLPPRDQLEFAKRVFRYVLIPLRYNQLFVEFAGGMRFDSHPEISDAWIEGNKRAEQGLQPAFPHGTVAGGRCLEKSEVRDLLNDAREYGFEIIPEVQSFGHVQYITYAHPEIAEREEKRNVVKDTRGEDARPDEFYAHCYCPSLDESYHIIYDLIDEIVEVARPQRYVHMGHDEIYQIGICPRCKDKDPAELYIRHVTAMHDYLAKKGLGMMIWSDMLHHTERYKTYPALHKLPRDIVMLDFIWYFHFDIDMEDHILPFGYKILMGNLYSSHYPRFETRIAKENMIGGQVSTWCLFNEYMLGKKGKFWDLAYTAEMLWSRNYSERLREVYNHIIAQYIQPLERAELRGTYAPAGMDKTAFALPEACHCGLPEGVLAARPAAIRADGAKVEIGGAFDRLVFEQTTTQPLPRVAWAPLTVLGHYTVRYEDGETAVLPVEYAGNVVAWNRRYAQPLPQQYYRHQGYIGTWACDPAVQTKSASGEDVLICGFVWDNPHPEKVIASVEYAALPECPTELVLAGIVGERRK